MQDPGYRLLATRKIIRKKQIPLKTTRPMRFLKNPGYNLDQSAMLFLMLVSKFSGDPPNLSDVSQLSCQLNFLLWFGIQIRLLQTGHRIIRPTYRVGPGKEFRHFLQVIQSSGKGSCTGTRSRANLPGRGTSVRHPEQITTPLSVG